MFRKIIVLAVIVTAQCALAWPPLRSTGIGVRGCYRDLNNREPYLTLHTTDQTVMLDTEGGGGWVFFFSRISENTFMEFSLGAVAAISNYHEDYYVEEVDVTTVSAATLGLRSQLFTYDYYNAFKPYVTGGLGPYWIHDVHVVDYDYGEEERVTVASRVRRGAYLGGGVDFMLNSSLGINFDVRYHFVNMSAKHEYSGFEYGIGVVLMWGRF